MPPQLEEVHVRAAREDAASSSTALILDRGRLPPGRVADGALGRLAFFLSEARPIASSAAKDVDDARLWLRWAEISQQMADAPTSSSVDAVWGIGDTVAHLHPPAGR